MTKQTETNGAGKVAGTMTSEKLSTAAGIIHTVYRVLRETAENRDALPPGSAEAMARMLCVGMSKIPVSAKNPLKTSLGDVAHILDAAFQEKATISPTVGAALANIIRHATAGGTDRCSASREHASGRKPETKPGAVDERGRMHVATIPAPPDLAAAGIEAIELWRNTLIDRDEFLAMKDDVIQVARAAVEKNKELDSLRKETDSLTELVAKGGLKDGETRRQILQRLFDLLGKVGDLKKDVDGLSGGKAPRAERVPDWRDTASGADQCSASREHVSERKPDTTGHTPCAAPEPKKEKAPKSKPADGTAEISGYFTPEEAADLTERIREWLSHCGRGHRLGDLMTSIEEVFKLSDGQLGELVGISSRLVCNVRHGRPSPSALVKFTETFGTEGGAK